MYYTKSVNISVKLIINRKFFYSLSTDVAQKGQNKKRLNSIEKTTN